MQQLSRAPFGDTYSRREHLFSGCSGQAGSTAHKYRWKRRQVSAAIIDPPLFFPEKLTISYINGSSSTGPAPHMPRRYTLTHNDLTGALQLTIGREYNMEQIAGFYTRLLRDEITAEWVHSGDGPSLHVHCHVSGEEKWLAPPILRNFIFRREMNLVLDTVLHADQELLRLLPELPSAQVLVHFHSDIKFLDRVEEWGVLGDRSSWQTSRGLLFREMWEQLMAWALGDDLDLADHLGQQRQQGAGTAAARPPGWARQTRQQAEGRQEMRADSSNGSSALVAAGRRAGVALVAAAAAAAAVDERHRDSPATCDEADVVTSSSCSAANDTPHQQQQQQPIASSSSRGATHPAAPACTSSNFSSNGRCEEKLENASSTGVCSGGSSSGASAAQPVPVPVTLSSRR